MLWFIIAGLGLVALAVVLFVTCIIGDGQEGTMAAAILCSLAALTFLVVFGFMAFFYKAASVKVNIINREYGTSYTADEIFYGSGVIDTIRQLNRSRSESKIDLNISTDK